MTARVHERPTLLLLPGLLCDRASWAPVLPFLAPHADCIVPDYSAESSLAAMAARAMADAPPSFAVAGHSMGGRVALEMVRRAPERIRSLGQWGRFSPIASGKVWSSTIVQGVAGSSPRSWWPERRPMVTPS